MARIALNGRLLVPGKLEGIGRFTLRCLEELVKLRPADQFLLLVDRPIHEMHRLGPNVEVRRILVPGRRPWLLKIWFGVALTSVLKRWKADAFVSLEGPLATGMPLDFPQLSVIHDLNFLHHPEWLPEHWARYYTKWFPRFARRANVLATVSDFSRMDLVKSVGLEPETIRVIPNAPDGVFQPLDDIELRKAQQEFAGGRPYFVFVGSLHPRKNIHGLLKAFVAYRDAGGHSDLVLVGEAMWDQAQTQIPAEHRKGVHWVGRLEDEALNLAIGGAQAMMFIPWFEGFGIPIVEAMACGTPVIASNTSSIPEVCGDAAFALKAPDDVEGLAQAMLALEADEEGRMQAIHRGKVRAGQFDWFRSGALLDRAVESLLASNP